MNIEKVKDIIEFDVHAQGCGDDCTVVKYSQVSTTEGHVSPSTVGGSAVTVLSCPCSSVKNTTYTSQGWPLW